MPQIKSSYTFLFLYSENNTKIKPGQIHTLTAGFLEL